MICSKCGSEHVTIQTFQENLGAKTVAKTKTKYKEKGHGCAWFLLIGWWWWIVDLMLWIFLFLPRFCVQLFKKKKYKGKSISISNTVNDIKYKTVCTCQNCGHSWNA